MSNEELRKKIVNVFETSPMASFATIRDGRPWVRYVMVHLKDSLEIFFTSHKMSRKVDQIHKNSHCHITVGGDPKDFTKPYVQVEGKAEVSEDPALKKELWNDYLAKMFKGPDDPNYIIVKIKPELFEFWGPGMTEPQVYEVK
ncbi:MAG: pyridoxamine 5'-phosphate oxidase family protein [Vulcanimicrobiota bacterium]